jgi:hypothetical protein
MARARSKPRRAPARSPEVVEDAGQVVDAGGDGRRGVGCGSRRRGDRGSWASSETWDLDMCSMPRCAPSPRPGGWKRRERSTRPPRRSAPAPPGAGARALGPGTRALRATRGASAVVARAHGPVGWHGPNIGRCPAGAARRRHWSRTSRAAPCRRMPQGMADGGIVRPIFATASSTSGRLAACARSSGGAEESDMPPA